jgi:outer membrane protein
MKRIVVFVCMAAVLALAAGTAMAESIKGRIGVTGRIGFLVPADSEAFTEFGVSNLSTDVGFNGGGGFIYGITDNIAAEIDITHTWFGANIGGFHEGDFNTTNISLGAQYRFDVPVQHLTPYVGAGLDILVNGFDFERGGSADVDTVVGAHISGGVDYFVMKQLALTTELKGVLAPDADIKTAFGKIGNYDPMAFTMTFGARFFFN